MPSVSKKQHNLMALVATDPSAAKRLGIKQSVGKDFMQADKGKKFKGGGMAKCKKYEEGGLTFAEMDEADRGEAARKAIEDLNARQAAKSEAAGGASSVTPSRRAKTKINTGDTRENLRDLDMQGADTGYDATERARNARKTGTRHFAGKAMKAGGSVRGCGIAQRGKTKGRMV